MPCMFPLLRFRMVRLLVALRLIWGTTLGAVVLAVAVILVVSVSLFVRKNRRLTL